MLIDPTDNMSLAIFRSLAGLIEQPYSIDKSTRLIGKWQYKPLSLSLSGMQNIIKFRRSSWKGWQLRKSGYGWQLWHWRQFKLWQLRQWRKLWLWQGLYHRQGWQFWL